MKKITHRFLGLLFIVTLVLTQLHAQVEKPKVDKYTLPNGLTVVLQEDHRLPKVHGIVVTRAGSINDPDDATGMAHYLEHMMFKGTTGMGTVDWEKEKPHYDKVVELYDQLGKTTNKKEREAIQLKINEASLKAAEYTIPNELTKLLDNIGATNVNAGTGYDITQYYSTFPSSQVERWLTLYSHIFEKPVFRGFQGELENVYEEFNMYADRQDQQLSELVMKNIFKQTPYGRSIIGYPEHLKNPSLTKLQTFFEQYYAAGNMALILCGDVDPEKVKPLIAATFGQWPAKPAPQESFKDEAPFKGRELVKLKAGPYDAILLNYRSVPRNHRDNLVLNICAGILNNGQSGLLDEFATENKALAVSCSNLAMKNTGVIEFMFVPNAQAYYEGPDLKFISTPEEYKNAMRQLDVARLKGRDAGEQIILSQLKRLKESDYPDWLIESVKNTFINNFIRRQESIYSRASELTGYFAYNVDIDQYLNFIDNVKAITKEDVKRVAEQYFTDNYMIFQISPGTIRNKEIEKPAYKALEFPNGEKNSAFAETFFKIQTPGQTIPYIDFEKDATLSKLKNGTALYYTANPVNDFFSLRVRYGAGAEKIKQLKYASLLNYAGGGGFDVKIFKRRLAELNCSLSVGADDSYTSVSLSGPGASFARALSLFSTFVNAPALYDNQVSRLAEGERINRKQQLDEPEIIADALDEYVRYGKESEYLDRLTLQELRKLKAANITAAFKTATEYEATIFYSGALPENQLKQQLEQNFKMTPPVHKSDGLLVKEINKITENTIYLVNFSALQAQFAVLANGKAFDPKETAVINMFNAYLSNGFTGLMMQELRENRSLAYGAGARYSTPPLVNKPAYFVGIVQTQNDKIYTAMETFMGLVRNMPQKADRMENLKRYFNLVAVNSPDFRDVPYYIESNKRLGYTDDPQKTLLPEIEKMTFEDIVGFWQQNVKDVPIAIMIVGNTKYIDMKTLAKYGKIVEVKVKDLFSKDEE
ncbi:MAG: insulinase family protein [Prevotellaceae bacterium]|jgi:predicted Zn-dependent peptidase|nr:insulinase family protein [Prevotellaceae bacterium]